MPVFKTVAAITTLLRLLRWLAPVLVGLLLLPLVVIPIAFTKSMFPWPVAAPTQVSRATESYAVTGWSVSSGYGWRPNPEQPGTWEFHDGADLAGDPFCDGCPVPPMADVQIRSVGWDQPYAPEPQRAGLGVVVDMTLQSEAETGPVRIRYGHLQPYQVWVRTQTCTATVDCPRYRDDAVGTVTVTCLSTVAQVADGAIRHYVYATPGQCRATVQWPRDLTPDGPTTVVFDQQIRPGVASYNAAITFRAQYPPPPPTPTSTPTATPRPDSAPEATP